MSKNTMWTADQILLVCDMLEENDWESLSTRQIHQVWRRLRLTRSPGAIGWESSHIRASEGLLREPAPTFNTAYYALQAVVKLYRENEDVRLWVAKLRDELDSGWSQWAWTVRHCLDCGTFHHAYDGCSEMTSEIEALASSAVGVVPA